jgi:hypothetical protein
MNLADMDKALVCSGPVSNISYDSHIVTRQVFTNRRFFGLFVLWT